MPANVCDESSVAVMQHVHIVSCCGPNLICVTGRLLLPHLRCATNCV